MRDAALQDDVVQVDREQARQLQALLDGPYAVLREATRQRLLTLDLDAADGLSRDDYRDLVLEWTRAVGRAGGAALRPITPDPLLSPARLWRASFRGLRSCHRFGDSRW